MRLPMVFAMELTIFFAKLSDGGPRRETDLSQKARGLGEMGVFEVSETKASP